MVRIIVTEVVLLTACEIFSHIQEVQIGHFRPLYSDCRPPSGGTPSNVNVIYMMMMMMMITNRLDVA